MDCPVSSADDLSALLDQQGYVASRPLAVSMFLALRLQRPLFLEGEPGTGKTEIARSLAAALGRRLIRLQCYEGLDLAQAAYEWNFAAQMIALRTAEAVGEGDRAALQAELFTREYLTERPLLQALSPDPAGPPVLLIDEIDRTDAPFEAFLLEVLSDYALTVPELGRIEAQEPPIVILTSNRTREVHDALKRRCLYNWVEYPDAETEAGILRRKVPEAPAALAAQLVTFVQRLREEDVFKRPGVAETLDWARALLALDRLELTPEAVRETLGTLLKYQEDLAAMDDGRIARLLGAAE
jgi:MoxR-like ATPase